MNNRTKIRTGDLILFNKWTILGLLSHTADIESRWSDVGVFAVGKDSDSNELTSVFVMTEDGARKVKLDTLLRDPLLQAASHRSLNDRDKHQHHSTILDKMSELTGTRPERIDILVSEYKNKHPNRTGYTNAELTGLILDSVRLMDYKTGILVSYFQEGGKLDNYYGKETPLFPRLINQNRIESIKSEASKESMKMVEDYYIHKPLMKPSDFTNYPRPSVNTENKIEKERWNYAERNIHDRRGTVEEGKVEASEYTSRRLNRLQVLKDEHQENKPRW